MQCIHFNRHRRPFSTTNITPFHQAQSPNSRPHPQVERLNLHSSTLPCFPIVSGSPIISCLERAQRDRKHTRNAASASSQATDVQDTADPAVQSDEVSGCKKRKTQNFFTVSDSARITKWMKTTAQMEGAAKIASKAVRHFPDLFRSSYNANIVKAMRLWRNVTEYENQSSVFDLRRSSAILSRVTKSGSKHGSLKAKSGRRAKRQACLNALHMDLVSELYRLTKLGVKFNLLTLRSLALHTPSNNEKPAYSPNMLDPHSQIPIMEKITARWMQLFAERFIIVSRAHTGKQMMSPTKELDIEQEVAYHLGQVSRFLSSKEIDEKDLSNADETHFVIDMDNGHTLGFARDSDVKYADVVSGGEGMTMMVRFSGGLDARIETPFMIFTNKNRSYPIRGVLDDTPGVAYRAGLKGWIDTVVFSQYLQDRRFIRALPTGRKRILSIENCSGHNLTASAASGCAAINTEIRYFPTNATHFIQPCDSFIVMKIKEAWQRRWENFMMQMIMEGKTFFLKLAADAVRDFNHLRDTYGLSYARKAMIMTGLALNTNGMWEECQLTPKLQQIIEKHREYFKGRKPGGSKE